MSRFERHLTLWVALCIAAGIILGKLMPGLFHVIAGSKSTGAESVSRCS